MPVFPLLSLLAGAAFIGLTAHPKRAAIVMGLLCWHTAESVAAHPDYLAYFTPPLRQDDYYYLSDSNLAWGQDRWRLVEWLEAHSDLDVHVFGAEGIGMLKAIDWTNGPDDSSWVIIDANAAAIILTEHTDDAFARMVRSRPWGRVGRSMLIYKRDAGEGSAP
jgi:hypothetical protein